MDSAAPSSPADRPARPNSEVAPMVVPPDRAARAFRYVDNLARIEGWLNETTALAMIELLWLQERSGIVGDLAEIGVFRGKSFLALAAGAAPGDRLLAVDIFDMPDPAAQRPEYDVVAYGQGNEAKFRRNLAEYFPGMEPTVIARSSADLQGCEREFGFHGLRFLSIDGGHTLQLTLNDLRIADACLTADGVCCLDDVFNVHWLGVVSGLFEFLQSGPNLVPMALFPNKLFLSRPARQQFYARSLRKLFPEALERERLELHRSELDVFGDTWPTLGGVMSAMPNLGAASAAQATDYQRVGSAVAADEPFDESWYLAANADVALAVAQGAVASGLAHYRAHGRHEGRHPSAAGLGHEDRRQKISAVWSVDADRRSERCGWYWLAHPMVVARVNTMISADPSSDAYSRLRQLAGERGWKLPFARAVSLGCGSGNLERDLVHRGLILGIDAYDLAEGAIERARHLAAAARMDEIRYHVADLESLAWPEGSLDVVFAHQAIHHVEGLETLFRSVRAALVPGGVFHFHEFIGPSRFQWTDAQLAAVNGYLETLPERLRGLPNGQLKPLVQRPTVAGMIAADPSEAVRSADILPALHADFDIVERRDFGGTLLHLALGDIAQNFDPGGAEDRDYLQRLFDLEERLLASAEIRSDFTVVTATPRCKPRESAGRAALAHDGRLHHREMRQ